ncbi:P-type ATPase [Schizosaccharomyces japonicus yFS275]|uniref:P-type ATPase n=1 Tax=Schizosaccharomyces japonicus (strain yFS275 / FY16936) TaxID=402676 RepID=B6JXX3_SCHJY|nr:P-type ATPase [Schizosaccharomyces japonicus yFS275]EEB06391.1 P-type ATPase [Schizosaccharomyces japonicus yFS275]
MSNSPLVTSPDVKSGKLYQAIPRFLHLYVWPFLTIGYPYVYRLYLKNAYNEDVRLLILILIVSLNALTWLAGQWNTRVYCFMTCRPVNSLEDATCIHVVSNGPGNPGGVERIIRTPIRERNEVQYSFLFQSKRYIFSKDSRSFQNINFPMDSEIKIGELKNAKGLDDSTVKLASYTFGPNRFDIPVPTFGTLFKEHAVAPYFVFQIFCSLLWCLDEYRYFALFTMFMIVALECSVVWQRQRTLNEFRTMSVKPYELNVLRGKKWVVMSSEHLLPNDVVSITRSKENSGLPCDLVLLYGTAVVNEAMLSGESTPLVKESIELRPENDALDTKTIDKNSLLFGGTQVLQVTTSINSSIQTPDGGVPALVLRTGFETQQGSLVRTMIYSAEKVTANNLESLFFILFLLAFAIGASGYVWYQRYEEETNRYKLLLHCVLIITSVVPSELPMELSLAVNASLSALSKFYIYCTEPFRISLAGYVDVCCFDKTGTLTEEHMVVQGVAGLNKDNFTELTGLQDTPKDTILTLATAHTLVLLEEDDKKEIVGDPMEKATLEALDWTVDQNSCVFAPVTSPLHKLRVKITKNFQFTSVLKRQTSVSNIKSPTENAKTFVSVKGAPEVIMKMLKTIPEGYEETYKKFGREGSRVLALGCKYMGKFISEQEISNVDRDTLESNLVFAGFLVFHSPLKPDAIDTIKMLNESSHRCVMITGDSPLTAVHVSEKVGIVKKPVLILENESGKVFWRSVDEKTTLAMDLEKPLDKSIYGPYDLCVTGQALALVKNESVLVSVLTHSWVYARVSPDQKEHIILTLKNNGYATLMCGDGTNDVGALKQAHIGVALLNASEDDMIRLQEKQRNDKMMNLYNKQVELATRFNVQAPPVPPALAHLYPPGPNNPHREKAQANVTQVLDTLKEKENTVELTDAEKTIQKRASMASKMFETLNQASDDEAPSVKLGDASVAAPFTSKLSNVSAITNIIRQGRCTLVALVQMHKILALNCLITAYSLSVLHLNGIKFSDSQYMISGMLMSVAFYSVSRSRPLETLSKERPHHSIFNTYIIGSVLAQFLVHVVTLIYITKSVYEYEDPADVINLESEFEPSLLNSAIYLLQLIQQVSTFAVNYQGHPFRESISENKGLYYSLVGVTLFAFACATEMMPDVNEKLQLVKMASGFQGKLIFILLVDYIGCWAIEQVMKKFRDDKPKDIVLDN